MDAAVQTTRAAIPACEASLPLSRTIVLAMLWAAGRANPLPPQHADASPGVLRSEFVFETAPFASAHASTITEAGGNLVAAWFGGRAEGSSDVGIWVSRRMHGIWTAPVEVANGIESPDRRFPCWNPVLFQPARGPLMLYYKVGPNPGAWWGVLRTSTDGGLTWSAPRRLPNGILGPIKNKPVALAGDVLLAPSSTEATSGSVVWRIHFERSTDQGATWATSAPPEMPGAVAINAIQPTLLRHPSGRLQALVRTQSGRVGETWSSDGGLTWTPVALTALPNPNAGIDAVSLRDGRYLLVYNHSVDGRSPLNVAVSRDGTAWDAALVLERDPGEYSYPAVIQSRDGLVHITYTWRRERIKHVVLDPARLETRPIRDGVWPASVK